MNGFVVQAEAGKAQVCKLHFDSPYCSRHPKRPDVMGYHDWREIPNYWDYASHFVLQDHMFESDTSWSLPEHLYLVSGWSAHCTKKGDPMSCHAAVQNPGSPPGSPATRPASRRTTPGPISPTSCTATTSAGATTSPRAPSPTARTTQMFCAPVPQNSQDTRHLEPAALVRHGAPGPPAAQHRTAARLLQRPHEQHPPVRVLDRARGQGQRPSAER